MPLSEEDMQSMAQLTNSTKDLASKLMNEKAYAFKKVIGDQITVNLMNMNLKGDMEILRCLVTAPPGKVYARF